MTEISAIASALPNYDVGAELGRGGFGIVHSGRHRRLGRPVAIKELPSWLGESPEVRDRFVSEARVLASLEHPHIVPIYDYVEQDGVFLLVMEHLGGGTVWEWFQSKGLSPEQACAIAAVTADALHHAHQHGVLHRDVKPENLLLSSSSHLKLTDFGIAKVVGGNDALVTGSGGILGTPAYMPPEQAQGGDLTPAVDVYAAGVMVYELLSGRLPYSEDGGGLAIVYRHIHEEPARLDEIAPQVPLPIAEVVMRAIARSQDDRYQSAEEFGVAVAHAAGTSFGTGWFVRSGIPALAAGPIHSSLVDSPIMRGEAAQSGGTDAMQQSGTEGLSQATRPTAEPRATYSPVRPQVADHVGAAAPADVPPVPIRQVLDVPPRPWALSLVALALGALVAVVAFTGLGSPSYSRTLPAGTEASVAGQDISLGGNARVDLSRSVPVEVRGLAATTARLQLSVIGVRLASSSAVPLVSFAGAQAAAIPLSSALSSPKYIVPGPTDTTLWLYGPSGNQIAMQQFTVSPATGIGFATLPGVVVILLILLVSAYFESLLRSMRRQGRWRPSIGIGLCFIGALGGVTLVGLAWVVSRFAPSVRGLVSCALLGTGAAIVSGLAASRYGRRARVRRLARSQARS